MLTLPIFQRIHVSSPARTVTTKHYRLGDSKHRQISHNSGGSTSELKVSAGLVPSEVSLLGGNCLFSSLRAHVALSVCLQISSPGKYTRHTRPGPPLATSFQPNHLFQNSIWGYSHGLRDWSQHPHMRISVWGRGEPFCPKQCILGLLNEIGCLRSDKPLGIRVDRFQTKPSLSPDPLFLR